jgi:tRNA-modifying protein YgfZ
MSSSVVWADLSREVIQVDGDDALAFLHSQFANDIAQMSVGDTVHSLLLEPTGHVVALVRVVRTGGASVCMDTEAGFGQLVIDRLSKFVLRSKVSMALTTHVVRAFRGADATEAIQALIREHPPVSQCIVTRPWWNDTAAIDLIGDSALMPSLGKLVDESEIDSMRVDAGWPKMGVDILAGDIPATTGVLPLAVSFTKGCYPGQELVERMDSRGTIAPVVLRLFDVDVAETIDGDVTSRGSCRVLARVKRSSLGGNELYVVWS